MDSIEELKRKRKELETLILCPLAFMNKYKDGIIVKKDMIPIPYCLAGERDCDGYAKDCGIRLDSISLERARSKSNSQMKIFIMCILGYKLK